jgi:hypothetical protein
MREVYLERLPAEIKVLVMRQLITIFDLKCPLTASSDYFRAFEACSGESILVLVKERERLILLREWVELGSAAREV